MPTYFFASYSCTTVEPRLVPESSTKIPRHPLHINPQTSKYIPASPYPYIPLPTLPPQHIHHVRPNHPRHALQDPQTRGSTTAHRSLQTNAPKGHQGTSPPLLNPNPFSSNINRTENHTSSQSELEKQKQTSAPKASQSSPSQHLLRRRTLTTTTPNALRILN